MYSNAMSLTCPLRNLFVQMMELDSGRNIGVQSSWLCEILLFRFWSERNVMRFLQQKQIIFLSQLGQILSRKYMINALKTTITELLHFMNFVNSVNYYLHRTSQLTTFRYYRQEIIISMWVQQSTLWLASHHLAGECVSTRVSVCTL